MSTALWNPKKEKQYLEQLTQQFSAAEHAKKGFWKKIPRQQYYDMLARLENLKHLWQDERLRQSLARQKKLFLVCEAYMSYYPYFLDDLPANTSMGVIFKQSVWVHPQAMDYIQGYLLIEQLLMYQKKESSTAR